ncbi:MAG: eIF2 kinase Gcn2p negative regulator [Bathelium mastoideum]|nr:MAG: eIF2 kinase Gcn2p negative regulator [Bathelium mastoideum]
MNPALQDELTSINAIFDPDTLSPIAAPSSDQDSVSLGDRPNAPTATFCCALRLPSRPSISLRLNFPALYPDRRPYVSGILTAGNESTRKGEGTHVQELVTSALEKVWVQGEPCVYDLVEECEAIILATTGENRDEEDTGSVDSDRHTRPLDQSANPTADESPSQPTPEDVSPQWTLSEPLTIKDSTFLARAAPVSSPAEARAFIAHLVATDRRAARATHNITAWRIRLSPAAAPSSSSLSSSSEAAVGVIYQDSDDDGESAAGGRVLKLMQLLEVWNAVVVVSRWFGGTLLGPERFRCIGVVAREALVKGGYVGTEQQGGQEQGKGKVDGKGDKAKKKTKK